MKRLEREVENTLTKERLEELEKLNNKTARLGLQKLWELSENHAFHDAGVQHDFAYLVAYDLVEMGETKLAKEYVKIADDEFKKAIKEIAKEEKSLWLKFQARLFSGLVSSYSFLRF